MDQSEQQPKVTTQSYCDRRNQFGKSFGERHGNATLPRLEPCLVSLPPLRIGAAALLAVGEGAEEHSGLLRGVLSENRQQPRFMVGMEPCCGRSHNQSGWAG